jgi:subtilisin family serine protease
VLKQQRGARRLFGVASVGVLLAALVIVDFAAPGVANAGRPGPISVLIPSSATVATPFRVVGRAKGASPQAHVVLEIRTGRRWRQMERAKTKHGRFSLLVDLPSSLSGRAAWLRVVLVLYGRRLRVSVAHRISLQAKAHVPPHEVTPTAPPTAPRPLVPVEASAGTVTLAPGSQAVLTTPAPIEAITALGPPTPAVPGVTVVAGEGTLTVSTTAAASPGSHVLVLAGEGCTASACVTPIVIKLTINVRGLAAPAGPLEEFTSPSPERLSAGTHLPGGATELSDELYVTLGTPDEIGTRAEAEADASVVGGVVSGGLEDLGVYEIRWTGPQNLKERTEELEARGAIVSPALPGATSTDRVPPGDWNDDGEQEIWPFTQIHAQEAWDTSLGTNVPVGIIDEGLVYPKHEDLDVIEEVGGGPIEEHATDVAGLACAEANGIGVVGAAWGCPIVSSGITDGSPMAVLAAATGVALSGVEVANMSLGYKNGYYCHMQSEQQGLISKYAAFDAGFRHLFQGPIGRDIVWTISAGNNCAEGVASPWGQNSDLPNVITVAATNDGGELASFSDFGPGVEVAAPGGVSAGEVGLWSTFYQTKCGLFGKSPCSSYGTEYGTSMSAPLVAGVAALVREAHPDLGAAEAATCITESAGEETGWVEKRSSHPTTYTPKVNFTAADGIPIVNAAAAVACNSFNSEKAGSYVGSWSGSGWILTIFQEGEGALSGVNQGETDFVNGCVSGPGLLVMTDVTATGSGQWDGLIASVDSSCSSYSYISSMALRAIRLESGEVALELAWPQEVGGPLPEIATDGTVESAAPYFSIWLYRPGTAIAAKLTTHAAVPRREGLSGVPLPAG